MCGVGLGKHPADLPDTSTRRNDAAQARLQLAAYRAMGPSYARLAAEHAAVLEALEEAGYELAEVEQFRALAAVTG